MDWSIDDLPDLHDQTILITGSNQGIGFETAAALAGAGATVVLACRNPEKAAAAEDQIRTRHADARIERLRLDLASQAQIKDAAAEALERFPRIDRLVNNAGVMSEARQETEDGFELMFGTNHLGHFAFTARIAPALLGAPRSRIVTVSSLSQRVGKIRWDDVNLERTRYREFTAYAQSKLAGLLFAFGLQRRLAAAGQDTVSLAAHPGMAATEILHANRELTRWDEIQRRLGESRVQTPAEAAGSLLRATTDPGAHGGQYYGPADRMQSRGRPIPVPPSKRSIDQAAQDRMWELSEELTGVEFAVDGR